MRQLKLFIILSVLCVHPSANAHGVKNDITTDAIVLQDSLRWADYYYNIQSYDKAIKIYENTIDAQSRDVRIKILKKLALSEAALEQPEESVGYLKEYLQMDFNTAFFQHEGFDKIRSTETFESITSRFLPKFSFWTFFYLFISLIGFYISIMLVINNNIDKCAKVLISGFVFIHSVFIFHIALSISHYNYVYIESYLLSAPFAFLYGPLLYFYLKRISNGYVFKTLDLLHLLPTLLLVIYLIPNHYLLPTNQKLQIMLERTFLMSDAPIAIELTIYTIAKTISLLVYGLFIRQVYLKNKKNEMLNVQNKNWQRNIYHIHFLYLIAYSIYGVLIILNDFTGVFFHIPIICMASMVIFVGYSASIRPNLVNGVYSYSKKFLPKYKKSGLTPSLSEELKEQLLQLFITDKIYKENNISLEMVAKRLNTTRHNTSQIINENFNVSFHEFVNIYRINEAKELLRNEKSQRLNIINVAYEVGYNNKVTFNKAFKKETRLTPSEYQKTKLRLFSS